MNMKWVCLVPVMLIVWAVGAFAQDLPSKSPQQMPEQPRQPVVPGAVGGPDVADLTPGDRAPSFKLDSSTGHPVSLADLKGRWAILVFEAGHSRFASLAAVNDSVHAMGARLFCVCEDGIGAITSYAERQKLRFPLLSDPTRQISQLFGMYDDANGAIQAGLVILDDKGVTRMVVQGPALHPDDVLTMVRHTLRGS
jgi:peroxiredoxin